MCYTIVLFNIFFLTHPASGPGTLPSDWPEQSGESIQTDHQELIREGNVWQGQSEAWIGQSCPPRHQPERKPQRGEGLLLIRVLLDCWTLHCIYLDVFSGDVVSCHNLQTVCGLGIKKKSIDSNLCGCLLLQVQQLSKLEVEDLLKKGAYGALMDEEDEGSKFCEEDIDQILQRRTQTITIQSEGKGSTFAKVEILKY